jgi:GTPase
MRQIACSRSSRSWEAVQHCLVALLILIPLGVVHGFSARLRISTIATQPEHRIWTACPGVLCHPGSSCGRLYSTAVDPTDSHVFESLSEVDDEDESFDESAIMSEEQFLELEEQHLQLQQMEEIGRKNKLLQPIRRRRRDKKEPLIAIIGRPNVGKSALVNRLAGTQSGGAIVADQSGITRDRTYRPAEFLGERFVVCDTGGLVFDDDESTIFAKEIREQALVAIEESAAVILVVDGQVGLTNMDLTIAEFLRKEIVRDIPVHVAVNKCESEKTGAASAADFWKLGLGQPIPVSALHGVGTAELLESTFDSIVAKKSAIDGFGTKVKKLQEAKSRMKHKGPLPDEDEADYKMRRYGIGNAAQKVIDEYEDALAAFDELARPEEINIAIIGRPNVGKSSLLNSLFGETRAIVSDVAGTTRDSIDAVMERPPPPGSDDSAQPTIYRFVDTAGIRRKGKIEFGPEFFMVNRALRAIRRADVVLLILDATAGVTEQDCILAQKISDDGRACAIICNKWDAVVDKDSSTYDKSVK